MTGFKFADAAGAAHTVHLLDDNTWSTVDKRVAEVLDQRFPRPQEVEDRAQLERRVISAAKFFRAGEVTPPLGHPFTPSWTEDAEKWEGLEPIQPTATTEATKATVAAPPPLGLADPANLYEGPLGTADPDRLAERPLGRGPGAGPADDRDL